jgi:hypothetical protein
MRILYKQFRALKSSSFVYTVLPMPHGNPKKFTAFRLDPELLQAVQAAAAEQGTNVTAAVEEGLHLWLTRAKRKAKGHPPVKHRTPPTTRAHLRGE